MVLEVGYLELLNSLILNLLQYAFRDRKNRKREFRALWIARINAASRELGLSYSKFINGLSKNQIILDRKILSDISIHDSNTFKEILNKSKS